MIATAWALLVVLALAVGAGVVFLIHTYLKDSE